MSVERRHYYRFSYLKSEHWADLRLRKLVQQHAKCKICKVSNYSNDVHHIHYRNLYDVQLSDLVVLCRTCHDKVHAALKSCQKIKTLDDSKMRWRRTLSEIRNLQRLEKTAWHSKHSHFLNCQRFKICRKVLMDLRLAKRKRMPWRNVMLGSLLVECPILFLKEYIVLTGLDPRYRRERIGPHKLLTYPSPAPSAK